jgi:hypothetical protein
MKCWKNLSCEPDLKFSIIKDSLWFLLYYMKEQIDLDVKQGILCIVQLG